MSLPYVPDYYEGSPENAEFDFARDEWVMPNAKAVLGSENPSHIIDDEREEQFVNHKLVMWVFGMFRYEDTVSGREYESRFCYKAYWITKKGKPVLLSKGPLVYRGEREYKPKS